MEADVESVSRWKHAHLDRIDYEIEVLRKAGATKEVAKWEWFRERFLAATSRIL